MSDIVIAALYHFSPLDALEDHQARLSRALDQAAVKGTILLAPEGVNGTIAGDRAGVDAALLAIRALPGCAALEHKESHSDDQPFLRLKVRLKKEIVTMGVPGVNPGERVGTYVDPTQWNEVIADPDTVVIDTRNDYEVGIGTFEGAINPETESFRDFPNWYRQFREENPGKRVAMFCTGGIRCEKASSFLLDEGENEVLHLKGGILKYLEHVPQAESRWQGECFVFDGRVSVKHGLELGSYDQCYACRRPITEDAKNHEHYEQGVSCHQCYADYSEDRKRAFAERQKQIALAEARGEQHLGNKADQ